MARTVITKTPLTLNAGTVMPALSAMSSPDDGASIQFDCADQKTVVLVKNTAETDKTVTFKKGNALQGTSDMTVTVAAGKTMLFVLESGRFVNASGEDRGKLLMVGASADLEVGCIVLP